PDRLFGVEVDRHDDDLVGAGKGAANGEPAVVEPAFHRPPHPQLSHEEGEKGGSDRDDEEEEEDPAPGPGGRMASPGHPRPIATYLGHGRTALRKAASPGVG